MIKGITAGKFINVQGGQPGHTYVNNSSGLNVGNMRYNTNNQNVEVYDGHNWIQLGMSYATVELNGEAQMLLEWARLEKAKQAERENRIRNNPALQKAYQAIKRAEDNFDIIDKLIGEESNQFAEQEQVQAGP